jgi:hypothetical protein
MNKLLTLSLISALTLAGIASAHAAGRDEVNWRQATQQRRIAHGLASGAITPREAVHLERREANVSRVEARYLADGYLSRREYVDLNVRLNSTSRDIYRKDHNGWYW